MTKAPVESKLKELMLYVAQRCEKHTLFGTIKMNKILFFADMNSFLRRGFGVTGVGYVKKQFGPVPKGIDALIEQMKANGEASVQNRQMPDLTSQKRLVALRKPNLEVIDSESLAIVDDVLEWMRPMTANEISELSHKSIGWTVARHGEDIPYATALLPDAPIPLSPEEVDYGLRLGQKIAERVSSAG